MFAVETEAVHSVNRKKLSGVPPTEDRVSIAFTFSETLTVWHYHAPEAVTSSAASAQYGIICANNPVNFVDPLGLCESKGVSAMDVIAGVGGSGVAGTIETLQDGSLGIWIGKNGEVYSTSWGGNGATGGRIAFAGSMANTAKVVGNAASTIATGASAVQTINAVQAGDTKGAIRSGADTVAGTIGFLGPYGRAFSAGYSVGRVLDDASGASKFWGDVLSR